MQEDMEEMVSTVSCPRSAEQSVHEAEQLMKTMRLADSDAVIDQALGNSPVDAGVLDMAIKVKLNRCEFTAARTLNQTWKQVCGGDHPLVRLIDFAERSGWPDAPATADAVAGYLRHHADLSKLHGSAIGAAGGQPVMILLFDIDDQEAKQLSHALRAAPGVEGDVRFVCAGRSFLLRQMLRESTGGVSDLLNAIMAGARPSDATLH